jgi:hypothetical protein|tara:strand:+ start:2013 stop:2330 length:318 start_codon:yes stop_codon:yes gene_type:complete
MSQEAKKSRKAIHTYKFEDQSVNLNGYVAICSLTGNEKRFYHSYLANMIEKKYNNNFAAFEADYVSREGRGQIRAADQVGELRAQIERAVARVATLQAKLVAAEG